MMILNYIDNEFDSHIILLSQCDILLLSSTLTYLFSVFSLLGIYGNHKIHILILHFHLNTVYHLIQNIYPLFPYLKVQFLYQI